ncbi:MAG: hypothetical protein RL148_2582, partial [Planctomycetota bacterium]
MGLEHSGGCRTAARVGNARIVANTEAATSSG